MAYIITTGGYPKIEVVLLDGERWCARYMDTFGNLNESFAGFGDSVMEAAEDLMEKGK